MTHKIEGTLSAAPLKIAVITARFNDFITHRLHAGALDCWLRHEGKKEHFTEVWVPGAFEIPLVAQTLAETTQYDAVICLGAVIRGSTSHYDYVCSAAVKGIADAGMKTGVPVVFGVLTTDTIEQAIERAGSKAGNKGWEATLTGIEMGSLMRRLRSTR